MWHASLLLLYTALPYNILVAFVKLLGAGVVLTWLQPHLQWFLSLFIGACVFRIYKLLSTTDFLLPV